MKKNLCIVIASLLCATVIAQPDYPAAPAPAPNLIRIEYFFDNDPGAGNGRPVTVPLQQEINGFTVNADVSTLPAGFHRLYLRSLDAQGKWSLTWNSYFDNFVVPAYAGAPTAAAPIIAAEYFIDTDPGAGNGTRINLGPSQFIINQNIVVNVTGLSLGVHRFYIRTLDASGKWSITNFGIFDNSQALPYPTAPLAAPPLGEMEYYIDTDPGFGNGMPISFTAGTDINNLSVTVPVNGLAPGEHTIYIRSKQNPWSLSAYASFNFAATLPLTWLYVRGELRQQTALINWATAVEQNTDRFEIEHSIDGNQFAKVGVIAAAGTSQSSRQYSFQHPRLQPGLHYYRIKQIDLDGQFSYSKVITLLYRDGMQKTIVAPNPVKDMIQVIEPANVFVKGIELYDLNGRLLIQESMSRERQAYSIPVTSLQKGMYVLKIIYRDHVQSFNIIKE